MDNDTTPATTAADAPASTGDATADRCYDCGKQHPHWFAEYLLALWDSPNASVTPELDAKALEFSETQHGGCFL